MPRETPSNLALKHFPPTAHPGMPHDKCSLASLHDHSKTHPHTCTHTNERKDPQQLRSIGLQNASHSPHPVSPASPCQCGSKSGREKKKKMELHVSSNKLGVCACAQFIVVHARKCVWVQPLPPLSMYTYTPPSVYIYVYIYTAYVQIEKKNVIGGGCKRGRLCFPSSTSAQPAVAAVAPPSAKECFLGAWSARGGGRGLGKVAGLGKGRGITCSIHPIAAGAR